MCPRKWSEINWTNDDAKEEQRPLAQKKKMLQTDKRWKEHWTVSVTRKPSQKRSDVASGYPGSGINGGATRDLYAKPHMSLEPTDFINLLYIAHCTVF